MGSKLSAPSIIVIRRSPALLGCGFLLYFFPRLDDRNRLPAKVTAKMDPLSFAESATSSLLNKLGSRLVAEAGLLAGVEDDVQYIMDELESMTGFLRALSERQDHDLQVKIWMKQVRELAYDAEDTIDVFTHRLRMPRGERGLVRYLYHTVRHLRMLKVRHGVASDLKSLSLRAHVVSKRRARYDLRTAAGTSGGGPNYSSASTVNSASDKARLHPPSLDEVKPVGIDGRRDEIVRWLLEVSQAGLQVISIVGLGGLGKTTLAMMVFESSKDVSPSFEARAWIAVSQSFERKTLLQKMAPQLFTTDEEIRSILRLDPEEKPNRVELERLMKNRLDEMGEMQLVTTIKNHLKEKRYVIVLDDIWRADHWESIKVAFPDNEKGSRIIVTTRNVQVAENCSSPNHQFIYHIPPLDGDTSWELFRKRVFDAPDYSCPDFLKNVSKSILKRCGGLPLAIVTIAGVLVCKPKEMVDEWQKFLDCMSSELETNPSLEGIRQILTLSYDDLPYYLKPCLLSLSTFPEDYEINRISLVMRWMAEGLINPKRDISDEEVAEGYFYELINRNLIIPSDRDGKGKVENFRVHDIMLELIVSLSLGENFITILNDHTKVIPALGKIRRISFHQRIRDPPHELNLSQARSVTVLSSKMPRLDYGKMRLLRVLDMEGCKGLIDLHYLKNISKLFLLKFLSLKNTSIKVLPRSIGNLQNLQHLDIRECGEVKIPNSVVKLQSLTYFLFDRRWELPKGIGRMKALQKCGLIDVSSSCSRDIREIDEQTQLEHLDVFFEVPPRRHWLCKYLSRNRHQVSSMERKSSEIFTSLGELHRCKPRRLTIIDEDGALFDWLINLRPPWWHFVTVDLRGQMRSIPYWFAKLDHTTKICLSSSRNFEQDITQVLKSLPALVFLLVGSKSNEWCFDSQGFKCLQKLHIYGAKKVVFREGALLKLGELYFSGVASFSGVEHLIKLNTIRLRLTAKEEVAELNRIAETAHPNHPKVVVEG